MEYYDRSVKVVDQVTHIRIRPGMYIGRPGDGSDRNSGIYSLLKEVIDRAVDEFNEGYGKSIEISVSLDRRRISVRDYGRPIAADRIVRISTETYRYGGMFYDGLVTHDPVNPRYHCIGSVGLIAVNALSQEYRIASVTDGIRSWARFSKGMILDDGKEQTTEADGTEVEFQPDDTVFGNFEFREEHLQDMVRRYAQLNAGLKMTLGSKTFISEGGLLDRLEEIVGSQAVYPPIRLNSGQAEIAFTHTKATFSYVESYVNGLRTYHGGTHARALEHAVGKLIYPHCPDCSYFVGIINLRLENPEFVDECKNELCSRFIWEDTLPDGKARHGKTISSYVRDSVSQGLESCGLPVSDIASMVHRYRNLFY